MALDPEDVLLADQALRQVSFSLGCNAEPMLFFASTMRVKQFVKFETGIGDHQVV